MQWTIRTAPQPSEILPLLVVPVFMGDKALKDYPVVSDDFDAKFGKTQLLYTDPAMGAARVLLVGLGERKAFSIIRLQRALGIATIAAQSKKLTTFGILMHEAFFKKCKPLVLGEHIARAVKGAAYSYDAYKSNEERHVAAIEAVTLLQVPAVRRTAIERGLVAGTSIANAITLVRDLGNTPPMIMTPTKLAEAAMDVASEYPKTVKCEVMDREQMLELGMGGVLGVAAGSAEPPKFIVMEYNNTPKAGAPIVLVGKGITFDSGGISIKPADKMDEMKFDMLGGATVIGTIAAVAALQLRVRVIGLIPATENLPGGSAYRPGDILRTMSGKTIEVLNTDAEGRIILADALSYAAKLKPRMCVDLATLTGACVVALGTERAGLFSQDTKVTNLIEAAAAYSGDQVWRMPLGEEYSEAIVSEIADVKNISGRDGSSSAAAAFLAEFVDYPWAHLDIAGTAWNMKSKPWLRAGATGHGVHLMVEFLRLV